MYEMIDMHSKYDNIHKNGMFYNNIYINNHIITCINCMLSRYKMPSPGEMYKLSKVCFDL